MGTADRVVWSQCDTSDKDILSSQRTQQSQFQALLLMTDDYTTATPGYWVSIAPVPRNPLREHWPGVAARISIVIIFRAVHHT